MSKAFTTKVASCLESIDQPTIRRLKASRIVGGGGPFPCPDAVEDRGDPVELGAVEGFPVGDDRAPVLDPAGVQRHDDGPVARGCGRVGLGVAFGHGR